MRWKINSGNSKQFKLINTSGNIYSAPFNSIQSEVNPGDTIRYRIIAQDKSSNHNKDSTALWNFRIVQSDGMNINLGTIPEKYYLCQNFPNPFNPNTIIRFQIKDSRFVTLKVYDITGKEIATLVNDNLKPGMYEVPFSINQFSNNQISSGVYFYKLTCNEFIDVKRMLLIK